MFYIHLYYMNADNTKLNAKREKLLTELNSHCDFVRGSINTVCAKCKRANCICTKKTSKKNFRLTYKDNNQKTQIVYIPLSRLSEIKRRLRSYEKTRKILNELVSVNLKIFKNTS